MTTRVHDLTKQAAATNTPVNVVLTDGYWIGKYEVTQSEWKQVMATEPWKESDTAQDGQEFPATCVRWNAATEFCRELTTREREAHRLPNDWDYALPTEAQWEYACRAGTETTFDFGDDESKLGEYAWFKDNSLMAGENYVHRVGQKKPNSWGLHDMHGNALEWCRDVYQEELPGGVDPEVTRGSPYRVYRGGSWFVDAPGCRCAFRLFDSPDDRSLDYGFRVVLRPVR
jgi:formylglycine-generating enzyme required for sulfatase activity